MAEDNNGHNDDFEDDLTPGADDSDDLGDEDEDDYDDLEDEGYGRRSNCRRCKMKIPRQADLACGNWGVIGDKAGKATFVEVCSEKGANLLDAAVAAGAVKTDAVPPKAL